MSPVFGAGANHVALLALLEGVGDVAGGAAEGKEGLEAIGVPRELFSATFAAARAAGWTAHVDEERRKGRLIRPSSLYVGPIPERSDRPRSRRNSDEA